MLKIILRSSSGDGQVLAGIIMIGIVVVIFGGTCLWTDRTLDFWLTYFKGHPVNSPFWFSALVTVILNAVIFAVNIISEIARLALVP